MYSLNVPLPGEVRRLGRSFHPVLGSAARETYTLLVKRLDTTDTERPVVEKRVRRVLDDVTPFSITVTHVSAFDDPTTGTGTVLYLAIDSPTLHDIHETLCDVVPPAADVEGPEYTPHITIGRTTDIDRIDSVRTRDIDPVGWTVTTLTFYDAATETTRGHVPLADAE